jgi:hypothetical protein
MRDITRRAALRGTAAVAGCAVATPAIAAIRQDDGTLMDLIGSFHQVYRATLKMREEGLLALRHLKAMPEYPTLTAPHGAWNAFMDKHGQTALWDKVCLLDERSGALAKRLFDTPANTLPGAIEKLKIAYMVNGDGNGAPDGDADLDAYQVGDPWMPKVIRDLERLAYSVS